MHLDTTLFGLGTPTLFGSRAFVPAFLSALLLRYGHHVPVLANSSFLQQTGGGEPVWFTHSLTITILGILAVLEVAASKSPEAQAALEDVDKYLKTGLAVLTFLGVLSATDQGFVKEHLQRAGLFDTVIAVVIGVLTFQFAALRSLFYGMLANGDEDDDLGVRWLLSWFEDIWATVGMFILIIYPVVMVLLLGLAISALKLLHAHVAAREEKTKTPCARCGVPNYPCAMACVSCHAATAAPCAVGVFGQSRPGHPADPAPHPFRLAEKKRCPVCATRLREREVLQTCPGCGHRTFADRAFADGYAARVSARLPVVLAVSALLSLIPVLGLIPGILYYRFTLVGPFRRYLPLSRQFLLKWGLRLFFFVLIAVQWVPAVGGITVPAMALTSFLVYRGAFIRRLDHP
jgi:hypothetical protein